MKMINKIMESLLEKEIETTILIKDEKIIYEKLEKIINLKG